MSYRYVYVANIALGSNDTQALKALLEADAYDGPRWSLPTVTASRTASTGERTRAAETYQPDRSVAALSLQSSPGDEGKNPLQLDSREPTVAVKDYAYNETRYRMLVQNDEARAKC